MDTPRPRGGLFFPPLGQPGGLGLARRAGNDGETEILRMPRAKINRKCARAPRGVRAFACGGPVATRPRPARPEGAGYPASLTAWTNATMFSMGVSAGRSQPVETMKFR